MIPTVKDRPRKPVTLRYTNANQEDGEAENLSYPELKERGTDSLTFSENTLGVTAQAREPREFHLFTPNQTTVASGRGRAAMAAMMRSLARW
jgi:hypothetical protein